MNTADKILRKREKWFGGNRLDGLTDEQIELLRQKFHKMINRYNQIILRSYIEN